MKNAKPLLIGKFFEILADFVLILLAFCAAYGARIGFFSSTDFPFFPFFSDAFSMAPIFVVLLAGNGLFSLHEKHFSEILWKILLSTLVGTMVFALLFFFRREFFFSRLMILYIFLFATGFLVLFHFLREFFLRQKYREKKGILRTLVIGNGRGAEKIAKSFFESGSRFQIVAALAPYGGSTKEFFGVPVLGKLDALETIVKREKIDAIIQTEAPEHTLNLSTFCEGRFLEFLVSPHLLGIFSDRFWGQQIGGVSVIRLSISPLFGWGQVGKRGFDLFFSSFFLILGIPFLLFKKTRRVSRASGPEGLVFHKYEFENARGLLRFFPEFLNVFRGEMSLVGPRPRSPKERQKLKLHERRRLAVKPGVFGLWQLAKMQGERDDLIREIALDTRYVARWSFGMDLSILAQSFFGVFHRNQKS